MHPRTDVVCLVHNQLDVTKRFFQHLSENTENYNLIIIDNGSEKETAEYLKNGANEGHWKLVTNKSNIGIVRARNQAVQHLTAEYFVNLDNDQFVQPGWLEALFESINAGFDVVGCEAWYMLPPSSPGRIVTKDYELHSRAYFPVKRCTQPSDQYTYIGCGGMLIKKAVVNEIGLFDETFNPAYFEDPDFSFRCLQKGFKINWQPNCDIEHLAHQTTSNQKLFSKNAQFIKSFFYFQKKWMPFYPGPFYANQRTEI